MNTESSKVYAEKDATFQPSATKALFEVEISTGNRGDEARGISVAAPAKATPANPLAVERQQRVKRRKRFLTLITLALLLGASVWGTAVWWQPILNNNVVARVNGQPITYDQVDREIRLSKAISIAASGKEQAPAPPSMLEQLILAEEKAQDARRANFQVTPQDIDDEIAYIEKQANITPEKLDNSLLKYGLTRDDLRASLANVVLANRFVERYVVSGITDPKARVDKVNRWQSDLVQAANVQSLANPTTESAPRVGTEAPDFALKDLSGKEVRLSSLRGKTVIINVWAPWCPPCRAEMPVLEKAYKAAERPNDGFELLAVATQSERANVEAFVQEFGATFPVLIDAQNQVTDLYQVGPIPTSFFVDKGGTIRAVQIGQLDASTLQQRLDAAR